MRPVRFLTGVLCAGSLLVLLWGVLPDPGAARILAQNNLPPAVQAATSAASLRLVITTPIFLRAGDWGWVHMEASLDPQQPLPAASSAQALARLELVGMEIKPGSEILQKVSGGSLAFAWQVRSSEAGDAQGTLWFGVQPEPGARQEMLAAPQVLITTRSLFGLDGPAARLSGGLGFVLAAGLWLAAGRKAKNG